MPATSAPRAQSGSHVTVPVPGPFEVALELTTACNYSCRHCAVSTPTYRPHTMSRDSAFDLIREMARFDPQPSHLTLSGHGESTVLPWFAELLDFARSTLPGVTIGFQTNGSMLAELAPTIVRSAVTGVCISVDGGCQQTFDLVRGDGAFRRLVDGLEAIQEQKIRARSAIPAIQFAVTLMTVNVAELDMIVDLAARFDVQGIVTQPLTSYKSLDTERWTFRTLSEPDRSEVRRGIDKAIRRARALGVNVQCQNGDPFHEPAPEWHMREPLSADSSSNDGPFFRACRDPWIRATVTARGTLDACCFRHADVAETIDKHSLAEIWFASEGLNRVRQALASGRLDSICRSCPTRPIANEPPLIPLKWSAANVD